MTDEATSDSSLDTVSTATTDAAQAPTQPSESHETTTQPSQEAAIEAPTPASAQATGDSLSTNTRSTPQQPPSQQRPNGSQTAETPNWENRWQEANRHISRLARENAEHKKYRDQWGDLKPEAVRDLVSRQQTESQRQALKPWHPQHPEYVSTASRLDRVESYQRTRQRILARQDLSSEQKNSELGAAAEDAEITNEDVSLFRQYDQHRKGFQERFTRDPESAIADIVERRVQSRLAEYDNRKQVTTATDQWLNDPKRAPILEKYADDVLWAMDQQTPRRDVGMTIAQLKAENEGLRARLGGQREVVETAAAQQAALRKRSTVTRDAVTAPTTGDPVVEAQKQGLQGNELLDYLRSKRRSDA